MNGIGKLLEIVADCLALDPEEVRPESRLFSELGADSLDYVELVFTMEKTFGVKLGRDDLSFLTNLDLTDPEVMKDGYLSPPVVERAAEWLPELKDAEGQARVTPSDLWSLVTIQTLWLVVEKKLAEDQ